MRPFNLVLITAAGLSLLATVTRAQVNTTYLPDEPKTRLEALERKIGTILIKANSPAGTITATRGVLSITCKESKEVSTGFRESGIAISLTVGDKPEDTMLIDHDELGGLLNAIDYLGKVDWAVTSLPNFSAGYETSAGFRIAVFVSKRTGTIEIAVRSTLGGNTPILLTRQQLSEFRLLIEQSKKKLDDLSKEEQPHPAPTSDLQPAIQR